VLAGRVVCSWGRQREPSSQTALPWPDGGANVNDLDGAMLARKTWRTLEPLHGMIYFVPEASEEYATLGLVGETGTSLRALPQWEPCRRRL
jgi:hypothetical protein